MHISNSNFINSFKNNKNVKTIDYLDNSSVKILFKDDTFQTYVLDEDERIIYCNLNGEIIQRNNYDKNGNLIKKTECTEFGYKEITYDKDENISIPINKILNGEEIKYNNNDFNPCFA